MHWARDAVEANAIVAGLVRDAGATEVVKVKSMVTQEIELNEALAREGIAAWETDLAELIVQLGHDLPSHILVPAIHRNRPEIREIFQREMAAAGRPAPADLTDDPRALAEAARLHLREKFLRARVAVSGANFAVADTGTVMVVESEGNGRMCVTLPDVLITVMGIEKLVPTWRDLEVFLQLLPRSSTAERMNPYTSMWTGVTPGDGPSAFHLILLDNGRTDTLSDAVGRQALRCIKCSACLNVCPVYERTGGRAYGSPYPGPIGAILTPQLRGIARGPVDEQTASLPYASSLCGACFDVCPVRIDIPEVLVHLRTQVVRQHGWRQRTLSEEAAMLGSLGIALGGPRRLGAAERAAGLAGRLVGRGGRIGRLPLPGMLGAWLRWRDLPDAGAHAVPSMVARPGAATMTGETARDAVLARIREALGAGLAVADVPRDYQRTLPAGTDIVELFAERVADYRATVHRATAAELAGLVAEALQRPWRASTRRPRRPPRCVARPRRRRAAGRRAAPVEGRPRRGRRRHHRLCRGDRRDRDDRARRRPGPGAPGAVTAARLPPVHRRDRANRRRRPRGARAAGTAAAADLDQRPVGDERHRAAAGRGRPRAAHPRGRDRRLVGSAPIRQGRGQAVGRASNTTTGSSIPFNASSPRGSNMISAPSHDATTAAVTRIEPAVARPATRAAVFTVAP